MSNIVQEIINKAVDKLVLRESEGGWTEMGSRGSGNWGHKGRPGKRGGSAPGGGKGRKTRKWLSASDRGRKDRRKGRNEYEFEAKTVEPLNDFDKGIVLGWRIKDMERGPKGFAEEQGLSPNRASKLMTWSRDAGLLEKSGNQYKLTLLGEKISEGKRGEYWDHIALMTGDRSLMTTVRPNANATAYWLYANYPKDVSTVGRFKIEQAWHKVTGDRWGNFTNQIPALEAGTRTKPGQPAVTWAHIADLDWIGLSGRYDESDYV